jgi:hypothetical protein
MAAVGGVVNVPGLKKNSKKMKKIAIHSNKHSERAQMCFCFFYEACYLSNGGGEGGLAVIDVPDGADVHVGLA